MKSSPRLLVLQHLDVEHPGIFRDFLREDGIAWDCVELDRGDPLPQAHGYAGLWVMGGPMDVWQQAEYPWLAAEMEFIRHFVADLRLPFLGICLGHQLLAAALGGEVAKGRSEVGTLTVELTGDGRGNPLFVNLPTVIRCLQWHGAEVIRLPRGARVLASSRDCAVQAMACSERAFSVQFHVEVTAATVPEWSAVPAYAAALDDALGPGAVPGLQRSVDSMITSFNRDARIFYANWMRLAGFK